MISSHCPCMITPHQMLKPSHDSATNANTREIITLQTLRPNQKKSHSLNANIKIINTYTCFIAKPEKNNFKYTHFVARLDKNCYFKCKY